MNDTTFNLLGSCGLGLLFSGVMLAAGGPVLAGVAVAAVVFGATQSGE